MNTQISLNLSNKLFNFVKAYAEEKGYSNMQEFIRELIREKLFEKEEVSGFCTSLASEKALSKNWLTKEEDEAWAHLKKVK